MLLNKIDYKYVFIFYFIFSFFIYFEKKIIFFLLCNLQAKDVIIFKYKLLGVSLNDYFWGKVFVFFFC